MVGLWDYGFDGGTGEARFKNGSWIMHSSGVPVLEDTLTSIGWALKMNQLKMSCSEMAPRIAERPCRGHGEAFIGDQHRHRFRGVGIVVDGSSQVSQDRSRLGVVEIEERVLQGRRDLDNRTACAHSPSEQREWVPACNRDFRPNS